LLRIKSVWGDPPVLAAWNASAGGANCRWTYVQCDTVGRVLSLFLNDIDVSGLFPYVVCSLSSLMHLDISNNNITDTFPTSLYHCGSLQFLDLSSNHFAVELPADIGYSLSSNLTNLFINSNNFNGTILASLSKLWNLRYLDVSMNNITDLAIPLWFTTIP
jgi:kinase